MDRHSLYYSSAEIKERIKTMLKLTSSSHFHPSSRSFPSRCFMQPITWLHLTQSCESSHRYCIHTSSLSTSSHPPACHTVGLRSKIESQQKVQRSQRVLLWRGCGRFYRTERVKSPGLLLLGRARKLPWTPRVNRSCSASIPVMLGWNHLKKNKHTQTYTQYKFDPCLRIKSSTIYLKFPEMRKTSIIYFGLAPLFRKCMQK